MPQVVIPLSFKLLAPVVTDLIIFDSMEGLILSMSAETIFLTIQCSLLSIFSIKWSYILSAALACFSSYFYLELCRMIVLPMSL